MSLSQSFAHVVVIGVIAVPFTLIVACGPSWVEPSLEGSLDGSTSTSPSKPSEGGAGGCDVPAKLDAVPDPTTLPACCAAEKGNAHCLPKAKATQRLLETMKTCDDGAICVPDSILKSPGAKPKSCKSQYGDGACRSLCIPEVWKKKDLLQQNECDAGEVCAPCLNPLEGNKPTGACPTPEDDKKAEEAAKKAAEACAAGGGSPGGGGPTPPATDGGASPATTKCCAQKGTCMPTTALPQESLASLNSEGCEATSQKCVPDDVIAIRTGKAKAQACTPNFFVGGGKGVCVSKCLEFDLFASVFLSQETCDEEHLCAPCVRDGKPTGAPGCE